MISVHDETSQAWTHQPCKFPDGFVFIRLRIHWPLGETCGAALVWGSGVPSLCTKGITISISIKIIKVEVAMFRM